MSIKWFGGLNHNGKEETNIKVDIQATSGSSAGAIENIYHSKN